MLTFPNIDPVALQLGPLAIRWYALAYIAGVVLGWAYAMHLAKRSLTGITPKMVEDSITWLILGIILGGRIGYVLFYNLEFYAANPLDIFMLWHGGMAFHGGALGVIIACWLFTKKHKVSFLAFTDIIVCTVPIGLFFGRIANFVNGELFGRVTDSSLGMVFPHGGPEPRHPSQLYEAGLEGIVLLIILAVMIRTPSIAIRRGFVSGAFLLFYGLFRGFVEFFREPDPQLGFLFGGTTMGQLLCIPMMAFGLFLMLRAKKHEPVKNDAA
jgi:phosphatidylglycerol:prolipoprotein diacylglycerol transferase